MKESYKGNLSDGRPIYIPVWPATVQFENLTQVCQYLGQDNVVSISALNVPAAMVAIMGSEDFKASTDLMMHFIKQARLDGDKLTEDNIDDMEMDVLIEIFTHVMHSQFNSFFVLGLAKVPYQQKQETKKLASQ